MPLITMDGKYETRDGKPVRVLCIDRAGHDKYPVMALVTVVSYGESHENIESYTKNGSFLYGELENYLDLVPAKTTVTVWINVYHEMGRTWSTTSPTKEDAERAEGGHKKVVVALPVTFKV